MLKKNKFILLCLLLFAVGPLQIWGQVGQYEYDELNYEFVESQNFAGGTRPTSVDVVKAQDGDGYVYAALQDNGSDRKLIAYKVDDMNNVVWQRHFVDTDDVTDFGSLTTVPAGGYAMTATIRVPNAAQNGMETQILLIRMDVSGNEMWSKLYGNVNNVSSFGHEVIATSAGGFAIVGTENSYNGACSYPTSSCSRAVVFLTDGAGALQAVRTFAGPPNREYILGHSIAEAKSGGYIIAGTIVTSSLLRRGFAMRLNANLGVSWAREYPINNQGSESEFYAVRPSSAPNPAGWILSGVAINSSIPFGYNMLIDNAGTVSWAKEYPQGGGGSHNILETIQAASGGYIALGKASNLGMVASKISATGSVDWQAIYGTSTTYEVAGGVLNASNGGYHFSGLRRIPTGGSLQTINAYVVKANDMGVSGCHENPGSWTDLDVPASDAMWTPDVQTEMPQFAYVSQLVDPELTLNVLCDFPCGVLSIIPSSAGPFCAGDPLVLASSLTGPSHTYTWTYNGSVIGTNSTLSIGSLPAGSNVYTLVVTFGDNCELETDITIEVNALPTVSAGHDQVVCMGEGTQLNGTASGNGPFTYSWSPSTGLSSTTIANPFCSPPSTTTYTLTVTDANGCSATDDVTITVEPLPTAFFADPGFICKGDMVTLCVNGNPSGLHYAWNNTTLPYTASGTDLNCVTFQANPDLINISVTVTSPNGCESTYQADIEVNDCCKPSDFAFPVDYVWTNTSATAEGLPAILVGKVILINGTFSLDQNLIMDNCKVFMGEDAVIDVAPGMFLQLRNSQIEACGDKMWDGIYLPNQSASLLTEGSYIKHAKNAVVSQNGGVFNIVNSTFDENRVHFQVEPFAGTHTGSIQSSELVCNGPLLAPFAGMRTLSAITVDQVGHLNIGSSSSLSLQNTIRNADYGINAQNSGLKVMNNRFENIDNGSLTSTTGTAILFQGLAGSASVNLDAGASGSAANYFTNCSRGIDMKENVSGNILFNVLSQIEFQGIQVASAGQNSMVIQDNHITEWGQGIVCTDMGQTTIDITRNRLDLFALTPIPGMLNEGIIVSNSSLSAFAPTVIELNVIRYPQVGIRVSKRSNAYLHQNRIAFDQNDATILANGSDFSGIVVARSDNSELRGNICNRVISSGPATQSMVGPFAGIRISDSRFAIVRYNTLDGFGNGIEVINQMSGTELECNFLKRCWSGVDFQGALIGDQGTPSANNGNTFHGIVGPYRLTGTISTSNIDWYYGSLTTSDPNPYNVTNFSDVGGVDQTVCEGGVSGKNAQGSEQSELAKDFEVYPNPTEGMVNISWSGFADRPEVTVTDMYGRVVRRVIADSPQIEMALTNLSKGLYFIHLDDGASRVTKKVILQ